MKSWQIAAELRPHRGLALALAATHVLAAALPWACRVEPCTAAALGLVALAMLPASWRRVPVSGRLRALALDVRGCACRDASGWWPAQLDPQSRVWSNLVYLKLATPAGRVEVLLTRANLGPADFRRLKVLVRGREGPGGAFC
jgi:hypothetical protein